MNLKYLKNPNTMLYLSDGSLTDKSGRGNNATNVNSVQVGNNGRFTNPFIFNGINTNYLTFPDNSDFKLTEFTYHFVAKATGTSILFNSRSSGGSGIYYGFVAVLYTYAVAAVNNNGGSNTGIFYYADMTKYNLISITFSSTNSNTLKIYVNGSYVAGGNQAVSYSTYVYPAIGKQDGASNGVANSLNTDVVILENRVWTASEIHKFYQQNFKL